MRWRFTLNPDSDNLQISEPIGWDDIVFNLKRDKGWHGVFFEYSLPLEFYNDPENSAKNAADYLRAEYQLHGVEGFVILKVELACGDNGAFEEEGQWRMNFTTYEELISDICTVKINLEPENCLMTFRNRYDQKVDLETELSFDGTELDPYTNLPVSIEVPPVITLQVATINSPGPVTDPSANFSASETDTVTAGSGTAVHTFITYAQFGMNPGTGHDSTDGLDDLDEISSRNTLSNAMFTDFADMESLYTFDLSGEYQFEFQIDGRGQIFISTNANNTDCSGDQDTFNDVLFEFILLIGGVPYVIYTQTDNGCFANNYLFPGPPSFGLFSQSVTVTAGQECKLYVRMEASGEWNQDLVDAHPIDWIASLVMEVNLTIFAKTQKAASSHSFFLINETGSRILEAITNDCFRLLSNYYGRTDSEPYLAPDNTDGKGSLRALTTGLLLRNYTETGKLILSFKDFFEALKAIDNVGIGIEEDSTRSGFQVVRLESAEYFYNETVLLQLDKVPRCVITVLQDEHYSLFKNGYKTYSAEEYYGLDEINTEREFRTSLQSVNTKLDQLCDWIASGYAFELTRRMAPSSTETKEDWRFDNNTFILCLIRSYGIFAAEQGNISTPTNFVDSASVLNYRISPIRNAMRWLKSIIGSYRQPDDTANSDLIFVTGTGNIVASGLMTGDFVEESGVTAENADLDIDSLADSADGLPIYVPELWTFDYPLGLADYNLLKANPRGTIQARFGQQSAFRDFYIREVSYKPNIGLATFRLLPKAVYPIDECCFYIIQSQTTGTTTIGSSVLTGADIENLFIFINGQLQKYNDADVGNNEIISWDSATGYGELASNPGIGRQLSILHIPPMAQLCNPCIKRYEGRSDGTDEITLTDFAGMALGDIFVFANGQLQKYNDVDSDNNEISGFNPATEVLSLNTSPSIGREIRAFGFIQCDCIDD